VSHIGDVSDIPDLVTQVSQVPEKHIEYYGGACMSQVRMAVYGRTANIHTDMGRIYRNKFFLAAA
jgi:hypothetical protein